MLQASTLQFLADLRENNDKTWFDVNKARYQQAKTEVEMLAGRTLRIFSAVDPSLAHLHPKECMFRIHRDVRFSADKSPYKTHMGLWVCKGGKKSPLAGYYLHVEPGQSFFGGGIYMPLAPELKKVRQEIAYCTDEFKGIVESAAFRDFFGGVAIDGHTLVKVPAGYAADHRAADYLKLKSFFGDHKLSDALLQDAAALENTLRKGVQIAAPLVHFINRALTD
jgi:uncharacterized protein (TIGR02453 family)